MASLGDSSGRAPQTNEKAMGGDLEENDNVGKDIEFMRWVSSTHTTLGCIGKSDIEVCSISIVPEHLRESNKDAYSPKVVSIGPLHRRTKRDLLYMKEAKWRCMLSLLHRTEDAEKAKQSLKECMEAMYDVEEAVHASYVDDDLKLVDRFDMAKIMLLDGCFLLELLISHDKDLNEKLKCRLPSSFGPIRRKEDLLSDLLLLENQIPLLVLKELFDAIFSERFQEEEEHATAKRISKLVLSLFRCSFDSNSVIEFNSSHLLELLHSFMTRRELEELVVVGASSSSYTWTIDVDTEDKMKYEALELQRCATKLHAAGVTIKPKKKNKCLPIGRNEVGFNFDIKFTEKKSLKIPKLQITRTTEAKWRNFIAWEHNRCDRTQITPLLKGEEEVSCKFSWYALFIKGLICCEHDIQLLKDKGIIVVHDDTNSGIINQDKEGEKKKKKKSKEKGMNNKELMIMLNKIADGVDSDKIEMDFSFGRLFKKLNEHQSTRNCFIERVLLFWHWLRCLLTSLRYKWEISYDILKNEYTPTMWKKIGVVTACIVLGISITQLVLKVITM